ncbi:hypothetical protein BH20ACT5_BH20ACT5_00040 [soil metagenome]
MNRWWRHAPAGVVVLVLAAVAIASPETARNTLTSPLAWAFIAGVAVVGFLLTRVVTRVSGRPGLGRAIGVLPVLAAIAWGALPALQDTQIDDAAPAGLDAAAPAPTTTAPTTLPPATTSAAEQTTATAAPITTAPTTTSAAPVPVELGSGGLQSLDYQATGTARLIRLEDDSLLVRFEGLDVENGPDYVVYLVPGTDQRGPGSGTFLGDLQGNQGDQNYAVPSGTAAEGPQTILIWCRSFAAPVANATV